MHLGAVEQPVIVALGIVHHQFGGVGVLDEKVPVIEAQLEDLVDDGQQQRTVGAGLNSTLSDSFQRRRPSGVRLLGLLPPPVALGDDVRQVFSGELATG